MTLFFTKKLSESYFKGLNYPCGYFARLGVGSKDYDVISLLNSTRILFSLHFLLLLTFLIQRSKGKRCTPVLG